MQKIVIIGNGVAGITAARHIRKLSDDEIIEKVHTLQSEKNISLSDAIKIISKEYNRTKSAVYKLVHQEQKHH